jgi:hypothetical protein
VGVDTVRFGDDINVATAVFSKVGDDLAITLSDPPDTLRIENQFASVRHGVERFVFADSFVLIFDQARQVLADAQVSGGDDVATGFAGRVDLMTGGAGHDLLAGCRGAMPIRSIAATATRSPMTAARGSAIACALRIMWRMRRHSGARPPAASMLRSRSRMVTRC